jgi:beta-lactamase class A
MVLRHVGPADVRRFVRRAGLTKTRIPDSTRTFFGYILGAPNWETFSWQDLVDSDGVYANSPLNDVTTLASSADDLVSYYARALNGRFFEHDQTLTEFRRTQTLGDAIWAAGFPLGVTAYCKGGSIDIPGYHALSIPGALYFERRWVYFSFTLNWYAPQLQDPATFALFAGAVGEALTLVVDALSD